MRASPRIAAGLFVLSGCSDPDPHPRYAGGDCTGPQCGGPGSSSSGGGVVRDAGGLGAGGGSNAVSDAGSHALAGNVRVFTSSVFLETIAFDGQGTIGVRGNLGRVAAPLDGPTYSFPSVENAPELWVDLTESTDTEDTVRTVFAIDGTASLADVAFANRTVVSGILNGLQPPLVLSDSRAELVLTFVDDLDVPVAGIEITQHQCTVVAYDNGTEYSDLLSATQDRGTVLLAGCSASPFPGGLVSVSFQDPSGTSLGSTSTYVMAAQGAVTFARPRI